MPDLLCNECGWLGEQKDYVKRYWKSRGVGITGIDVPSPILECPKCNSENLIELTGGGSRLSEPVLV